MGDRGAHTCILPAARTTSNARICLSEAPCQSVKKPTSSPTSCGPRSQRIQARIVGGFTAPAFYVYSLEIDHAEKLNRIQAALDTIQSTFYTWRARRGLVDANDPDQRAVVRFSPQPPVLEVSRPKPDRLSLSAMPLGNLHPSRLRPASPFSPSAASPSSGESPIPPAARPHRRHERQRQKQPTALPAALALPQHRPGQPQPLHRRWRQ